MLLETTADEANGWFDGLYQVPPKSAVPFKPDNKSYGSLRQTEIVPSSPAFEGS